MLRYKNRYEYHHTQLSEAITHYIVYKERNLENTYTLIQNLSSTLFPWARAAFHASDERSFN